MLASIGLPSAPTFTSNNTVPSSPLRIEIGGYFGAELGEIAREMAGVVREDEDRLAIRTGEAFRVNDQPADRTADVEEIHRGGADAGMLRAIIRAALALFDRGHHLGGA